MRNLVLALVLALGAMLPARGQARVEYIGGTAAQISVGSDGSIDLADEHYLAFYSKKVRVRVAYDRIGGNPFNKHSKYDFDLTGKAIDISAENMTFRPASPNVLHLSANGPDFRLEASGFDQNRDLVVDARAQ